MKYPGWPNTNPLWNILPRVICEATGAVANEGEWPVLCQMEFPFSARLFQ